MTHADFGGCETGLRQIPNCAIIPAWTRSIKCFPARAGG